MKAKEFADSLVYTSDLCPPATSDKEFVRIMKEHFLGKDWHVVMPISYEQVNTEAIYCILNENQPGLLRKIGLL